ncbi:hypothetical protein JYU34_001630 [Plutella xylostella]|uniref:C2H2-type domain-containing protein n=1 Tax=Plutella xylostella TaxID=51655 RepID=A0ABQ7R4F1_PLUXY|nr:hypothetical protein JYU34_001630 [Plutella xylostella]
MNTQVKMDAETLLHCPLCCGGTFKSKQSLVEHLSNHTTNFGCPICTYKFSSVSLLVEHLSSTNCKTPLEVSEAHNALREHRVCYSQNIDGVKILVTQADNATIEQNNEDDDCFDDNTAADNDSSQLHNVNLEDNKMYTDLLRVSEQLSNDQSEYSIAHSEDAEVMTRASIITKQNSDGTLSISTYEEKEDNTMKEEPVPVITVTDNENVGHEELFSCNTCGVSFLSVIDHIQNYHKDQDVVVEMNENQDGTTIEFLQEEGIDSSENNMPMELVSIMNNSVDKPPPASAPHRIITDTGNIVETTVAPTNTKGDVLHNTVPLGSLEMEVTDKEGRVFTRRYVQIDKGPASNCEAAASPEARTPYHQVVVAAAAGADGSPRRVYSCIACRVHVTELDHFKAHPCKTLKYSCAHCPVSYENAKSLCAHMKVHKAAKNAAIKAQFKNANLKGAAPVSVVVTGPFKCHVCSTVFPTNKSLKLHKRMHDPIKARPIDPPVDDNPDPTDENNGKYFCPVCLKWIPTGYRAAHAESHSDADNFNCDICNKRFRSSAYRDMHMNVHSVEKTEVKKSDKSLPYTCLYCSRQFARPHEKVKHERIHTGEKPHSCEICGKSFRVSYCLTLHMRTHTGARPYACHICGKRFKAHSVYNHHLLTHSDVRAYKCPFCPKAFKTSVQLAGHKNSHTKPFSCTHCNRPFASLYAVRVHTETHRRQNNLKFTCSLCGARYARSFALKDHMKSAHDAARAPDAKFSEEVILNEEKGWEISDGKLIKTIKDDEQETAAMEIPNEPESVILG